MSTPLPPLPVSPLSGPSGSNANIPSNSISVSVHVAFTAAVLRFGEPAVAALLAVLRGLSAPEKMQIVVGCQRLVDLVHREDLAEWKDKTASTPAAAAGAASNGNTNVNSNSNGSKSSSRHLLLDVVRAHPAFDVASVHWKKDKTLYWLRRNRKKKIMAHLRAQLASDCWDPLLTKLVLYTRHLLAPLSPNDLEAIMRAYSASASAMYSTDAQLCVDACALVRVLVTTPLSMLPLPAGAASAFSGMPGIAHGAQAILPSGPFVPPALIEAKSPAVAADTSSPGLSKADNASIHSAVGNGATVEVSAPDDDVDGVPAFVSPSGTPRGTGVGGTEVAEQELNETNETKHTTLDGQDDKLKATDAEPNIASRDSSNGATTDADTAISTDRTVSNQTAESETRSVTQESGPAAVDIPSPAVPSVPVAAAPSPGLLPHSQSSLPVIRLALPSMPSLEAANLQWFHLDRLLALLVDEFKAFAAPNTPPLVSPTDREVLLPRLVRVFERVEKHGRTRESVTRALARASELGTTTPTSRQSATTPTSRDGTISPATTDMSFGSAAPSEAEREMLVSPSFSPPPSSVNATVQSTPYSSAPSSPQPGPAMLTAVASPVAIPKPAAQEAKNASEVKKSGKDKEKEKEKDKEKEKEKEKEAAKEKEAVKEKDKDKDKESAKEKKKKEKEAEKKKKNEQQQQQQQQQSSTSTKKDTDPYGHSAAAVIPPGALVPVVPVAPAVAASSHGCTFILSPSSALFLERFSPARWVRAKIGVGVNLDAGVNTLLAEASYLRVALHQFCTFLKWKMQIRYKMHDEDPKMHVAHCYINALSIAIANGPSKDQAGEFLAWSIIMWLQAEQKKFKQAAKKGQLGPEAMAALAASGPSMSPLLTPSHPIVTSIAPPIATGTHVNVAAAVPSVTSAALADDIEDDDDRGGAETSVTQRVKRIKKPSLLRPTLFQDEAAGGLPVTSLAMLQAYCTHYGWHLRFNEEAVAGAPPPLSHKCSVLINDMEIGRYRCSHSAESAVEEACAMALDSLEWHSRKWLAKILAGGDARNAAAALNSAPITTVPVSALAPTAAPPSNRQSSPLLPLSALSTRASSLLPAPSAPHVPLLHAHSWTPPTVPPGAGAPPPVALGSASPPAFGQTKSFPGSTGNPNMTLSVNAPPFEPGRTMSSPASTGAAPSIKGARTPLSRAAAPFMPSAPGSTALSPPVAGLTPQASPSSRMMSSVPDASFPAASNQAGLLPFPGSRPLPQQLPATVSAPSAAASMYSSPYLPTSGQWMEYDDADINNQFMNYDLSPQPAPLSSQPPQVTVPTLPLGGKQQPQPSQTQLQAQPPQSQPQQPSKSPRVPAVPAQSPAAAVAAAVVAVAESEPSFSRPFPVTILGPHWYHAEVPDLSAVSSGTDKPGKGGKTEKQPRVTARDLLIKFCQGQRSKHKQAWGSLHFQDKKTANPPILPLALIYIGGKELARASAPSVQDARELAARIALRRLATFQRELLAQEQSDAKSDSKSNKQSKKGSPSAAALAPITAALANKAASNGGVVESPLVGSLQEPFDNDLNDLGELGEDWDPAGLGMSMGFLDEPVSNPPTVSALYGDSLPTASVSGNGRGLGSTGAPAVTDISRITALIQTYASGDPYANSQLAAAIPQVASSAASGPAPAAPAVDPYGAHHQHMYHYQPQQSSQSQVHAQQPQRYQQLGMHSTLDSYMNPVTNRQGSGSGAPPGFEMSASGWHGAGSKAHEAKLGAGRGDRPLGSSLLAPLDQPTPIARGQSEDLEVPDVVQQLMRDYELDDE